MLHAILENFVMFTRKISTDSFDQSLLNERNTATSDSRHHNPTEISHHLHQPFDPETGEVFQKTNSPYTESSYSRPIPNDLKRANHLGLPQLKELLEKTLPTILIHLTFAIVLSWMFYHLMNEHQLKISAQSNQLKHINQGQSEILDAIDELHESLSSNILDTLNDHLLRPSTPNNLAQAPSPAESNSLPQRTPPAQKKLAPKLASLKNVKYLGSIKRHDIHQVLIEIDGKVKSLRIGDELKEDWRLSAIDEKKIIATTIHGSRHIIDLARPHQ
jgi:hypothetical protein